MKAASVAAIAWSAVALAAAGGTQSTTTTSADYTREVWHTHLTSPVKDLATISPTSASVQPTVEPFSSIKREILNITNSDLRGWRKKPQCLQYLLAPTNGSSPVNFPTTNRRDPRGLRNHLRRSKRATPSRRHPHIPSLLPGDFQRSIQKVNDTTRATAVELNKRRVEITLRVKNGTDVRLIRASGLVSNARDRTRSRKLFRFIPRNSSRTLWSTERAW